jgi:hypothetical protein
MIAGFILSCHQLAFSNAHGEDIRQAREQTGLVKKLMENIDKYLCDAVP